MRAISEMKTHADLRDGILHLGEESAFSDIHGHLNEIPVSDAKLSDDYSVVSKLSNEEIQASSMPSNCERTWATEQLAKHKGADHVAFRRTSEGLEQLSYFPAPDGYGEGD